MQFSFSDIAVEEEPTRLSPEQDLDRHDDSEPSWFTSDPHKTLRTITSCSSISEMGMSSLPSLASFSELFLDPSPRSEMEDNWTKAGEDDVCLSPLPTHAAEPIGELDSLPRRAGESRPSRPVSDFRKYKTELCKYWETDGQCAFGAGCIFAHGEAELRSETNNETLKLANDLLGGSEEHIPRRRTRRRRHKSAKSEEVGEENEGAEPETGISDGQFILNTVRSDFLKEQPKNASSCPSAKPVPSPISPLAPRQNTVAPRPYFPLGSTRPPCAIPSNLCLQPQFQKNWQSPEIAIRQAVMQRTYPVGDTVHQRPWRTAF